MSVPFDWCSPRKCIGCLWWGCRSGSNVPPDTPQTPECLLTTNRIGFCECPLCHPLASFLRRWRAVLHGQLQCGPIFCLGSQGPWVWVSISTFWTLHFLSLPPYQFWITLLSFRQISTFLMTLFNSLFLPNAVFFNFLRIRLHLPCCSFSFSFKISQQRLPFRFNSNHPGVRSA